MALFQFLQNYVTVLIGSTAFVLIYAGVMLWWDLRKYSQIIKRLKCIESKLDSLMGSKIK